jgi:hypothetical protein
VNIKLAQEYNEEEALPLPETAPPAAVEVEAVEAEIPAS